QQLAQPLTNCYKETTGSTRGSQSFTSGRSGHVFSVSPRIEERGSFGQSLFKILHLASIFGSRLPGFVALFFGASQQGLERFRCCTRFLFKLRLPLRAGCDLASLGLRIELGDQVLFMLLSLGEGKLLFFLDFLAELGLLLLQAGLGFDLMAPQN